MNKHHIFAVQNELIKISKRKKKRTGYVWRKRGSREWLEPAEKVIEEARTKEAIWREL